jgi:hypothetical protein
MSSRLFERLENCPPRITGKSKAVELKNMLLESIITQHIKLNLNNAAQQKLIL